MLIHGTFMVIPWLDHSTGILKAGQSLVELITHKQLLQNISASQTDPKIQCPKHRDKL